MDGIGVFRQMKALLTLIGISLLFAGISPIWANEDLDLTNYEIIPFIDENWGINEVEKINVIVDGIPLKDKCYTYSKYSSSCVIVTMFQNEKIIKQNDIIIQQNQQIIDNLQILIDLQTTNTVDNIYGDYP